MFQLSSLNLEEKMNSFNKIADWGNSHHPKWLDILRISLGIILIVKGVTLIEQRETIVSILQNNNNPFLTFVGAHYVIIAHIFGGLALVIGLLTRLTAALEIPILIGAMLILNISQSYSLIHSGFEFTILVFLLLVIFLIYGPGPLSIDNYFYKHKEATEE
jgi:putative oxidoreductase